MAFRSTIGRMLRIAVVLAAATVGLGLSSAEAPMGMYLRGEAETRPLPGLLQLQGSLLLVHLDPSTLAPLPRPRLDLGNHGTEASLSPDRSRLVLASSTGRLLFVDLRRFKRIGTLETGAREGFSDTAWFRGRLLAVSNPGGRRVTVYAVDPARPRVLARRSLAGSVLDRERTARELVLLLGPKDGIGPVSLLVVDGQGSLRRTSLERIVGGSVTDELAEDPGNAVRRYAIPGLAVDPARRKAFVVAAGAPLAEIDLETLAVSYHELSEPVSVLGRVRDWLEPVAQAKSGDGPYRRATWLGSGALAVSGFDEHGWIDEQGKAQSRTIATGVRIVDVGSGAMRTVDASATTATKADGLLLTTGHVFDSTTNKYAGVGLRAYGVDGSQRYHLLGTASIYVQTVGERVVASFGGDHGYQVLDLRDGSLVRAAKGYPPILLAGTSSFDG